MANTSSAKKALRVSSRKSVINSRAKKAYKLDSKKVLKAENKSEALAKAYKSIDKAAKGGVIHKKTASRHKSRLAKKAQ